MSDQIEMGSTWGRWTVVKRIAPAQRYGTSYMRARVRVRCVCGEEKPVFVCDLRSGKTAGCRSRRCQDRYVAAKALRARLDQVIADFLKA